MWHSIQIKKFCVDFNVDFMIFVDGNRITAVVTIAIMATILKC